MLTVPGTVSVGIWGEGTGWDAGRRNTWQSWWQTWVGHANWHYQSSYISFHSGKQSKKKVEEITLFITFFCNETFLIFCNEMSGEEASLPADALSFPSSSPFQVSSLLQGPLRSRKPSLLLLSVQKNINSSLCQNSTNKYWLYTLPLFCI